MTNSSLLAVTMLSPFHSEPRNQPISKITPHHVAGKLTVEAVGRIFQTPGRNASSNYGIGQGRVAMYVEEKNRAWTSSSAWNDNRAVTFEVANSKGAPNWEISQLDWDTMVNLCVDICQRNPGITQKDGKTPGLWFDGTQNASLTFHRFFSATSCPGDFIFSRAQQLCNEVNAKLLEEEAMNLDVNININDVIHKNVGGLLDGRTFTPARLVAEALGATVNWDADTRTVIIKSGKATVPRTTVDMILHDVDASLSNRLLS